MVDISALGNLNTGEQLDLSKYPDVKESSGQGFRLPKRGVYVLRAPDSFTTAAFGATRNGDLSVQVDPTIVGPTNEGLTVKFVRISAKTFQRRRGQETMTASQIGDYLRSCAYTGKVPGEPQKLADLIEKTAGTTYQAELDWKAYEKSTGFSIEGMENFPKDATTGEYQPWIEVPGTDDGNGKPVRARANLYVRNFIAAVA